MKYCWLALYMTLLIACSQPSAVPTTKLAPSTVASTPAATGRAANAAIHVIVDVTDGTTYLRAGWKRKQTVRFGTTLYTGDIIERSPAGHVVLVCADLTMPPVPPAPAGVPCSDERAVLVDRESELTSLRGEVAIAPLLLLAPLPGALLGNRPEIRWTPVSTTSAYTITLSDDDGELWSTSAPSGTTTMPFPRDQLPLAPGKRYTLVVMADGELSSERATGQHKLYLFDPQLQQTLDTQERQIQGFAISDIAKQLLIARLLLQYDLISEAEARLTVITSTTSESTVFLTLGEIETCGLLYERAIEYYTEARTLAEAHGDDETAALAAWRMGRIYLEGIANPALARANLMHARELYSSLLTTSSDSTIIKHIDADMAKLPDP